MEKKGISQEWLKVIACVTMLLDHMGASVLPYMELRIIGRIAFPIYCFLLAEGIHYTQNPKKYGFRLLAGALLAEIPFDLLFFGGLTLAHSSVMVTLLLGFCYGMLVKRMEKPGAKLLLAIPFMILAELLGTDYGGWGVAMIGMFLLTRNAPHKHAMQLFGLAVICWLIGGAQLLVGTALVPIELFGVFALLPIWAYSGEKSIGSKWIQWGFYLFYPVHMAILLVIAAVR